MRLGPSLRLEQQLLGLIREKGGFNIAPTLNSSAAFGNNPEFARDNEARLGWLEKRDLAHGQIRQSKGLASFCKALG